MGSDEKIILGFVGEIGSGKDAIAHYLSEHHNFQTISFSKPLRDVLDRLHLPQTRENMVWLGYDLRNRFGTDVLDRVITDEVNASNEQRFCLPNVRLEADITQLKLLPGFTLIRVEADAKIRYERLNGRGQNTDDHTKTWEEFLADAELPTEKTIREIAKQATHTIHNNSTIEELHQQIEELLKKIGI